VSRYQVYATQRALREAKELPGHVRQRAKRAIRALADNPRPSSSRALDVADFDRELRRLKLDHWRIVYAITEAENAVDVLAVRKRPPYDYGDLETLLSGLI
jgi:mRNA interferase RelE/StbE